MICSRCQGQNSDNVNFCVHCGAPLRTTCPNCGTVNSAGAKFCINCGNAFGVTPPVVQPVPVTPTQPVVVVKQGISGWVWAIIGVLIGVIVIGGLGLSGLLTLNLMKTAPQTQLPVVEPVIASTQPPTALAPVPVVESYCPKTGGVILYWSAGFDCKNDTSDLGFRQRVGDGTQNLNTGQFDNQASAIQIPPSWSVKLYEDTEQRGASVCLNRSVSNLEDHGNFPNKAIPINDNVSSMEVFRDGTCGQDLAAGAEPAPFPKDIDIGLDAPAGIACTDQAPCACLPQELKDLIEYEGAFGPMMSQEKFNEQYVDSMKIDGDKVEFVLKNFGRLYDEMVASGLILDVTVMRQAQPESGGTATQCEKSKEDPDKVICSMTSSLAEWQNIKEPRDALFFSLWYESEAVQDICATGVMDITVEDISTRQCPNPRQSVVCGSKCCANSESCVVLRNGKLACQGSGEPESQPEPEKQCDPSDSCCLDPSLSGC